MSGSTCSRGSMALSPVSSRASRTPWEDLRHGSDTSSDTDPAGEVNMQDVQAVRCQQHSSPGSGSDDSFDSPLPSDHCRAHSPGGTCVIADNQAPATVTKASASGPAAGVNVKDAPRWSNLPTELDTPRGGHGTEHALVQSVLAKRSGSGDYIGRVQPQALGSDRHVAVAVDHSVRRSSSDKQSTGRRRSSLPSDVASQMDIGKMLSRDDAVRALALSVIMPDDDLLEDCFPSLGSAASANAQASSTRRNSVPLSPQSGCGDCYRRMHVDLFDVVGDLRWVDRMVRWPFEEAPDLSFLTTENVICVYMAMLYGGQYMTSSVVLARANDNRRTRKRCPWKLDADGEAGAKAELINRRCLLMVVLYIVYSYGGQQTAYVCWPFIHAYWSKAQFTAACLALADVLSKPLLDFNRQPELRWAYAVMLLRRASETLAPSTVPCKCRRRSLSATDVRPVAVDLCHGDMQARTTAVSFRQLRLASRSSGATDPGPAKPAEHITRKLSSDSGLGESTSGTSTAAPSRPMTPLRESPCIAFTSRLPRSASDSPLPPVSFPEPIIWSSKEKKFSTTSADSGMCADYQVSCEDCAF